jgi:hypothetical protein
MVDERQRRFLEEAEAVLSSADDQPHVCLGLSTLELITGVPANAQQ